QIHAAVVVAVENGVENATRLRLSLLHFSTRIAEDFRQSLWTFLRSLLGGTEDLAEHGRQDLAEDFFRGLRVERDDLGDATLDVGRVLAEDLLEDVVGDLGVHVADLDAAPWLRRAGRDVSLLDVLPDHVPKAAGAL